ncbi:methylcrotonoyl-CoA carboxylase subunit alpha, mitochondrial [Galendromus occidentalis]|uniref:Methylcrotonoyl-CoA carboxylase subunit alpha, mitochondrial n=1 Tax=Galendromus occidentalis TaxID=34638 RepID=A0AAJ6VXV7_9ACAR|nr:methylcrotonoyl-CoA carboxylase subunit alpha, mitochondrial [Galendromus occidentalis]
MAAHIRLFQLRKSLGIRLQSCRGVSSLPDLETKHPIDKLLIANRGEIACRIIRSARKLGIRSVAIYSDVDKNSVHVREADEAYRVGTAAAAESYLRQDKIIEVAKHCGAKAIHPGYGFLSENVEFAELCKKEDLIFVGPPVNAIRDMGIKSTSKQIMAKAGVPIIEGYHGVEQDDAILLQEAKKIGFPVMLKAVRGGGGKGMRIAMNEAEFESQLESARREAMKSFGDNVMLVEKFVVNPRHVEVQVFGDQHGNHVYLFERDCSIQRRHQKIIEEAPAPGISDEVRRRIGAAAVRAAKAVDYVGAGTVEFVMDSQQKFYFMEMNTRLQVEHPITELITGVDLVEWQLLVASGASLPLLQEQIEPKGHAFEARIYAEDPKNNFMPAAGFLKKLRAPADARVDTGVQEGDEVSVHYDPMIAKLVVWGSDRQSALAKLKRSLGDYIIAGMPTNIPFLMKLCSHPSFRTGDVHTEFIPQHKESLLGFARPSDKMVALSALSLLRRRNSLDFFRLNMEHIEKIEFKYGDGDFSVEITAHSDDKDSFTVRCGSFLEEVKMKICDTEGVANVRCELAEEICTFKCSFDDGRLSVFTEDDVLLFDIPEPSYMAKLANKIGVFEGGAVAPMPGVVEQVLVSEGQEVVRGQSLVVMIAMKMEYVIRASGDGIVSKVMYKKGDNVAKNTQLVQVVPKTE